MVFTELGLEVRSVANGAEALADLKGHGADVVFSDLRMPVLDGFGLLSKVRELYPELVFIAMSAYGSRELALKAVGEGAFDFLEKPFPPEEAVFVLRKAEERQRLVQENRRLRAEKARPALERIIGESEQIATLKSQLARLARVGSTVLIQGESGVGKELVARAIHEQSARAEAPFVAINCGAIPEGLLESELFGHAKGAFTDAHAARRGVFTEADGGTLLLDEVAELPPTAQVKLLRALQDGEVRPVGESRPERVDVRVIAATHRNLQSMISAGRFREDLYFRLSVAQLSVPPLRARGDDIRLLAEAFVARFNRSLNRRPPVTELSPELLAILAEYPWPGNVRELENAIEHALIFSDDTTLSANALPEKIWSRGTSPSRPAAADDLSLKRAISELEERYIRQALRRTGGNRTRTAELLELSPRTLLYKIRGYGIDTGEGNES